MSDCCNVSLVCREQDVVRFEMLGFEREEWDNPATGVGVAMRGEDMNYGATSALKALATEGIPFTGSHGAGGDYGEMLFASAGGESIWVDHLGDDRPAVGVARDGTIDPPAPKWAMTYYRLDAEAERLIAASHEAREAYLADLSASGGERRGGRPMKAKPNKAIRRALFEAYRRNQMADAHEAAKPLVRRWLGLGSESAYRAALQAGMMRWVHDEPPPKRCMGWLCLTQAGIEAMRAHEAEFAETLARMNAHGYQHTYEAHYVLMGGLSSR